MNLGDDYKPEFLHYDSYFRFARHVLSTNRYVWDEEVQTFLDTVRATIQGRDDELEKNTILYRAQRGVDWCDLKDSNGNSIGEDVLGFGPSRMKPFTDRAREGRANPTGIPVIYVATTELTAISEIRPWIGEMVSLAKCKIQRPLRVLKLSRELGKSSNSCNLLGYQEPTPTAQEKEKAVWNDIDKAFSRPVTHSDDLASYVPTQILAELFRNTGYDAIAYKSNFGDDSKRLGYNIAIFDLNAVEIVSCTPFRVKAMRLEAEEAGNPWYRSS